MKTSSNGISLITSSEGLKLKAYQDATGTWTIGYGHTLDVYPGQTITKDQALAYLASDLVHVENYINQFGFKINQNQFDALVDLLFNCGIGVLENFIPLIKANPDDVAITNKMSLYVYSKSVKLPGLVTRRAKEVALYKKKVV
jgi:lysozyme